jgi:hypothetical protein
MRGLLALLLCGLLGCKGEDPVLKAAREAAEVPTARGNAGGVEAPAPGGHPIDGGLAMQPGAAGEQEAGVPNKPLKPGIPQAPRPGDPSSPSPGKPGNPQPGVAGEPAPGVPQEDSEEDSGPTVLVQGQVRMLDYRVGGIRLDFFDGDHRSHAGQRPSLVRSVEIQSPGVFEVQLPLATGKVWIEASNDENQDGRPGPRDPSGRYLKNPLLLSAGGATGIVIDLERNDPPPGGGGAEL